MKVVVEKVTDLSLAREACEFTMHGQKSKISMDKLAQCEHSPLRTQMYFVKMYSIPTFVSVHFVRHKIGVEHFVKTMRDDLFIDPAVVADRNTPVNHGMFINAQALIQMARKRLCYKSHKRSVATFRKIVKEIKKVDPELAKYLVPECVYRNGYCPEITECKPGLIKVVKAYEKSV